MGSLRCLPLLRLPLLLVLVLGPILQVSTVADVSASFVGEAEDRVQFLTENAQSPSTTIAAALLAASRGPVCSEVLCKSVHVCFFVNRHSKPYILAKKSSCETFHAVCIDPILDGLS